LYGLRDFGFRTDFADLYSDAYRPDMGDAFSGGRIMSGTTAKRNHRQRNAIPLSIKHELERAHWQNGAEARDVKARRAEYRGLTHSTDGRKRLARLSALRVQVGVAQRRRITVRHMLHGDMS
jgi:hypothetical protein